MSHLRDLGFAVLLLAVTVAAYAPALHGELLLDDDLHITRPELQSVAGLGRIWSVGTTQQFYPVLHTVFWVEHHLWGDAVFGYHLANVLLHVTAALLLVACMRRLRLPGGWIAAFVFAVHPVCVESVAWIAEQKNTLSTVFYLAATLAYLRFDDTRDRRTYALAYALFVAALLSKTATATLPVSLLIVLWWRRGRLEWRRDVLVLIPWVITAVGAGLITIGVERALIAGIDTDLSLTWAQRIAVAGQALWFYLSKLTWPANLSFFYERWSPNPGLSWQYVGFAGVLAVTAAFVRLAVRWRGPLAAWLLFVGALSPVLGLVDVEWFVFSFLADHFQYLACIAIIVPLSAGLANVAARFSFPARASAIAGSVAVIATLTALTWRYSHAFRDNVALYGNAAVRAPGSAVAHHHLGFALARFPARRPEAIAEYEAALRINSHAAEVHEDLGAVLVEMPGRLPEAITHLETALQLKPGLKHARRTLAGAHFDAAKALAETPAGWADAISHYERAVQLDPAFAEAYFNLGNALLKDLRRRDEAIACFEHAVRIKPDFPEAHTNLGVALASIPGRLPEAIAHFEAALKANPDFTPARTNLQRVQHLLGDPDGRTR